MKKLVLFILLAMAAPIVAMSAGDNERNTLIERYKNADLGIYLNHIGLTKEQVLAGQGGWLNNIQAKVQELDALPIEELRQKVSDAEKMYQYYSVSKE